MQTASMRITDAARSFRSGLVSRPRRRPSGYTRACCRESERSLSHLSSSSPFFLPPVSLTITDLSLRGANVATKQSLSALNFKYEIADIILNVRDEIASLRLAMTDKDFFSDLLIYIACVLIFRECNFVTGKIWPHVGQTIQDSCGKKSGNIRNNSAGCPKKRSAFQLVRKTIRSAPFFLLSVTIP